VNSNEPPITATLPLSPLEAEGLKGGKMDTILLRRFGFILSAILLNLKIIHGLNYKSPLFG